MPLQRKKDDVDDDIDIPRFDVGPSRLKSESQSQRYQTGDLLPSSQSQVVSLSNDSCPSQQNFPSLVRRQGETDGEEEEEESGDNPTPINLPDSEDDHGEISDDGFQSEISLPAEVVGRIEALAGYIVEALAGHQLPELQAYSTKSRWRRKTGKKKSIVFHNMGQCRLFSNVLLVLSFCHSLLLAHRTTTTREVYYFYVTHFRSQKECDAAIGEAANLLRVPRSSLGLFASPKGWFCGCIQIIQNGRVVLDGQALASLQGAPITQEWLKPQRSFTIDCQVHASVSGSTDGDADNDPHDDSCITNTPQRAKCILVIEKEGIYNRFSEDRLFERFPCILVTGKGFPDLATRSFVHSVHQQLNLPVLGLADCNPFGLLVLQTYQYGSARLGLDGGSRYSVPIQWVGLQPSQVEEINQNSESGQATLPPGIFQNLSDLDRKRLEQLLDEDHPFHASSSPEEKRYEELEIMEENGYKVELESLNWLGMDYMTKWIHGVLTGHERKLQESLAHSEEDASITERDSDRCSDSAGCTDEDEDDRLGGTNTGSDDENRWTVLASHDPGSVRYMKGGH